LDVVCEAVAVPVIRVPQSFDVERLQHIEDAADTAFFELFGIDGWGPAPVGAERSAMPGFLLVAADSPDGVAIGFVHVLELDGHAHLEQLSVHPSNSRQGVGRALVSAAKFDAATRGFTSMTLRTYADIPWNAPFYSTCGFVEQVPDTPGLARLIDVERNLGLDRFGRRIQMTARLDPPD